MCIQLTAIAVGELNYSDLGKLNFNSSISAAATDASVTSKVHIMSIHQAVLHTQKVAIALCYKCQEVLAKH